MENYMKIKSAESFDLNEKMYALLNCKNGIVASILRDFMDIDILPYFNNCYIPFREIVAPIDSGDIAGVHFGNAENGVWQELFAVEFSHLKFDDNYIQWLEGVVTYLETKGPLLAPHDGFYDINAADKYQKNHTLHNSFIFGVEKGRFHLADRHIRTTVDSRSFYDSVAATKSSLLGVDQAREYAGDWDILLNDLLVKVRDKLTLKEDLQLVKGCIESIVEDAAVQDGNGKRWKQSHSYIKAVGASRDMTAKVLERCASRAEDGKGLVEVTEMMNHLAKSWNICSALAYKYEITNDSAVLSNLKAKMIDTLTLELGMKIPSFG